MIFFYMNPNTRNEIKYRQMRGQVQRSHKAKEIVKVKRPTMNRILFRVSSSKGLILRIYEEFRKCSRKQAVSLEYGQIISIDIIKK